MYRKQAVTLADPQTSQSQRVAEVDPATASADVNSMEIYTPVHTVGMCYVSCM